MAAKDADPRLLWPTRSQAAARTGVSKTTIHRKEKTGELHPVQLDGIWRFDPEELDNIQSSDEELDPVGQFSKVIAEFSGLLKTAHEHIEELHKFATNFAELQKDEIVSLRSRAEHYETRHFAMLELTETLHKEQHSREMERMKEDASERRKMWVMGMLQNQVLPIIMNRGVGNKLVETVMKLDLEKLEMLAQSGIIDEPTMLQLLEMWHKMHPTPTEEDKPNNGKETVQ